MTHRLELSLLPSRYAICRLSPGADVPAWVWGGVFASATRTSEELSLVCEDSRVPAGTRAERDRRALRVHGPLDLSLTGILASLTVALAEAKISIFVVSTFDTDYLLVQESDLERSISALERAGHTIHRS